MKGYQRFPPRAFSRDFARPRGAGGGGAARMRALTSRRRWATARSGGGEKGRWRRWECGRGCYMLLWEKSLTKVEAWYGVLSTDQLVLVLVKELRMA